MMLSCSPCVAVLPIFLAASTISWGSLFLLSVILSVTTVSSMVGLTILAYNGARKINLCAIEHYERGNYWRDTVSVRNNIPFSYIRNEGCSCDGVVSFTGSPDRLVISQNKESNDSKHQIIHDFPQRTARTQ